MNAAFLYTELTLVLVGFLLVVLKLVHAITWSWWIVAAPTLLAVALVVGLMVAILLTLSKVR